MSHDSKVLTHKAKLSVLSSIFIPIVTCGVELWLLTKRLRMQTQAAEITSLHRASPVQIKYSQFKNFRNLVEQILQPIERGNTLGF